MARCRLCKLILDGLSGGRDNVSGENERPGRLTSGCQAEPVTSKLTEREVDALADFYTKTRSY